MELSKIFIVRPGIQYEAAFRRAFADYVAAGESNYVENYAPGTENFARYVQTLVDYEQVRNMRESWVPSTTRWLLNESNEIAGFVRVRHCLNEALLQKSGHIGYDVPPSQRQKGYGHACLRAAIDIARELSLPKVLLTCDSDNQPSRKVIEAAGAKFLDEIIPAGESMSIHRYWLNIE
jgi:predicted acetyltransferase